MVSSKDPILLYETSAYNYRLVKRREELGYSLKMLSKLTGISHNILGIYERLERIPKMPNRIKIANALEVDVDYLFSEGIIDLMRTRFPHKMIEGSYSEILFPHVEKESLRLKRSLPENKVLLENGLNYFLSVLTLTEKHVIKKYFGLDGGPSYTLEEIGGGIHKCRERVRQIKEKALRDLRHGTRAKVLEEYIDL